MAEVLGRTTRMSYSNNIFSETIRILNYEFRIRSVLVRVRSDFGFQISDPGFVQFRFGSGLIPISVRFRTADVAKA